jgi:hypothetical protein
MDVFQEQCLTGEIKACLAGRIDAEILPATFSADR